MNIHNVLSYVHNFNLSDKFQVVFEAHGSSYTLIFTLSGRSYDSKNYFQKFRFYMPRIFGVAKKSETF